MSQYGKSGPCAARDTCMLDPACEFHDWHREDAEREPGGCRGVAYGLLFTAAWVAVFGAVLAVLVLAGVLQP